MDIERIDPPRARQGRKNDPDQTRRDIIEIATREFARLGLAGARIDRIADQTKTSKRMIYYYFGSKEGLYLTVLEEAYRNLRQIEGGLKLEGLAAEAALREYQCPRCFSKKPGEGSRLVNGKPIPCECASPEHIEYLRARGIVAPEDAQ